MKKTLALFLVFTLFVTMNAWGQLPSRAQSPERATQVCADGDTLMSSPRKRGSAYLDPGSSLRSVRDDIKRAPRDDDGNSIHPLSTMDRRPLTNNPPSTIHYAPSTFATPMRPGKVTRAIDDFVETYKDPHSPDSTNPFSKFAGPRKSPEEELADYKKTKREKLRKEDPAMAKAEDLFRMAAMLENDVHYYLDSIPLKFFEKYCKKPLIELMNKNPNASQEDLIPQAMEIIVAESERLLLIDMKGLHPLKDLIQLGHIDRGAVLRTVINDDGSTVTYLVTRAGLVLKVPENDEKWKRYISILQRIRDKDTVREIFDRFIKERYQDKWRKEQGRQLLGITDNYINEVVRDPLIDRLATQTVFDTVIDLYLLFPVPDMAAISQTRRGIKNKLYDKETNTYYGIKDKPYSLWLPYLGICNLMDVYPETAEQDILRLAVEKGLHLGIDDHGHKNIVVKDDIGRVIEHDWGFEARIYAVFKEGELQARSEHKLSPAEQRALITKTMELFARAKGKGAKRIYQKSTAEFYANCYEILRNTILQHPEEDVDTLWHYVMRPMREKGYALLHTNLYNRHPIKNFVIRCFYYFQEVLRLPSPALKEDIYWATLEGKVPFEYKNEPFWVTFKKMHDGLLSNEDLVRWVYRERVMNNVNDEKRTAQGRKALEVPLTVQDDYIDDHTRKLMTDMHLDTFPQEGYLLEADKDLFINGFNSIILHSRRGVSNPAGYEGATYGVSSGFLTQLISLMGENGNMLYVNNFAEEARHWDKGDEYDHGEYEKADDFEMNIEHDSIWEANIQPLSFLSDGIIFVMQHIQSENIEFKLKVLKILLIGAENLKNNLDKGSLETVFKKRALQENDISWDDSRKLVTPFIKDAFEQTLFESPINRFQVPKLFNQVDTYFYFVYYNFLHGMWDKNRTDGLSFADEQRFYDDTILNKLSPAGTPQHNWRFDWDRPDYVKSVYKVINFNEERYLRSA
ncbi:MAG: hypothetical protein JW938_06890 [Candidatus Omnitrophica bacterium]|nr:hypothetical protein [Candidatus Omnitrophota bacterium]